ncbi:unnamed protein product, partial [Rotaria sp. Silwood2]
MRKLFEQYCVSSFSFPLDSGSDSDEWEDINDIDNDDPIDVNENLIDAVSDLINDEEEKGD